MTTVLLEPPCYGNITLNVESSTAGASLNDLLGNVYCVYSEKSCQENSYLAAFITDETGTAYKVTSVYDGDMRPAELEGENGWYTDQNGRTMLYAYGESNSKGYTFISDCSSREMTFYSGTYYLRGFITGKPLSDYYVADNTAREIEVPYDTSGNLTVYIESDIDSYKVEYIEDSNLYKYLDDSDVDEVIMEGDDVILTEDELPQDYGRDENISESGAYYVTRNGKLTHYTGLAYSNGNDYQDADKALEGWYVSNDGKLDLEYEGIIYVKGEMYYCNSGQIDESVQGWIYTGKEGVNGRNLFENGKENLSFNGFDCVDGGWIYLKNSRLFNTTDIIYGNAMGENAWWFVKDGYISYEESVEMNSNGWWYVNAGKVDFGFKGFAPNSNGWWYLENGQVSFKKNDILFGPAYGREAWWLIKNSKVSIETTVANNAYGWWYVKDGAVDFEYNGYASNSNGWWYLENGQVSFKKNDIILGDAYGKEGWWLVKDSKVSLETTVANNSYGWWYVKSGMVNFSANTVAHNSNGWWKITDGKVDFGFTGLASNENGTWYLSGGKVDFGYNGTYAGKKIVNGKVS